MPTPRPRPLSGELFGGEAEFKPSLNFPDSPTGNSCPLASRHPLGRASMIGFTRKSALAIAIGCILIAANGTARAAGAFAVGACGAYGYGYDYRKPADARTAAMKKCSGKACKVVGEIRRGCAALAVDAKHPC